MDFVFSCNEFFNYDNEVIVTLQNNVNDENKFID